MSSWCNQSNRTRCIEQRMNCKNTMFELTFPWAPHSLGWTWFPTSNFLIRLPVSSRTGTHPYLHYSSAQGLPISLQSKNHLNWSSARTWRTAWKAHEGKHLCDVLSAHCNTKQKVSDHCILRHKTSITRVVPLLLPKTTYANSQHKVTHQWRLSSQSSKHEAARHTSIDTHQNGIQVFHKVNTIQGPQQFTGVALTFSVRGQHLLMVKPHCQNHLHRQSVCVLNKKPKFNTST